MRYSLLASACFIASASAHATFQDLWINGVDQGDSCVRLPLSNNPVTSVSTTDIICNVTPTASSGICTVPAGASVTVEMHQQPGDRSCANQAIGGDHYGPINIYMAKVSNAATAAATGLSWFKISEIGMPSDNPDYWGTEVLNDNCGHYTFTVPASIASGNYLLRAEVIALHVASSSGGAQFYMSCYQINVTGGGSTSPAGVSFPGAYSASDPGILINIYQQLNSYVIPGPSPYGTTSPTVAATAWPTAATWNTAGQPSTVPHTVPGGSAATTAAPTTTPTGGPTTSAPTSVKTTAPTTTAPKSTTTAGTVGTVAQYGQCGGTGWTGGTVCISPYTCTYSNAYYSQCL